MIDAIFGPCAWKRSPLPVRLLVGLGIAWAASPGLGHPAAAQVPEAAELPTPLGSAIRCVAFSPDGKFLAAATGIPKERGRVALWELANRRLLWTREEDEGVPTLAFSPDGKLLAIAIYDKTAKLLDAASGEAKATLRGHTMEVRAVAFSADGKLLATGSWDQQIKLWALPEATLRQTLAGNPDRVYSLAFSPDGKFLAAAGISHAGIWDLPAMRLAIVLKGHKGSAIQSIEYSRDGRWVITGGWDSEVRVWDAATGNPRARFATRGSIERATMSSDGRVLAACGRDSAIEIFQANLHQPSAAEQDEIARLIRQLDEESYAVREKAEKDLAALGYLAESAIRQAAKETKSPELRLRCRRILAEMPSRPARLLRGHTDSLRTLAFSPGDKILASGGMDGSIKLWSVSTWKELATYRLPAGTANSQR